MSSKGCACGKYLLAGPVLVVRPAGQPKGEVHRFGLACYREGGSRASGLSLPRPDTMEGLQRRIESLERVVGQLIGLEDP